MRLAGVAQFYHWPRAELLGLTAGELAFWEGAANAYNEASRGDG